MSVENKRVVEINGVKVEVDLRTAKVVEHFKVGDPVRVFHPKQDFSDAAIRPGVIVGFCEFDKTPAIQILELEVSYSGVSFNTVVIAEGINNNLQIAPYNKFEGIVSKADVVTRLDRMIQKAELDLSELMMKKKYFIDNFAKAFDEIVSVTGMN